MKKILIVVVVLLLSCNENKIEFTLDSQEYKDSIYQDSVKTAKEISDYKFASDMARNEMRLGMSRSDAMKYRDSLMDSLKNVTHADIEKRLKDDFDKYKQNEDSLK